MLFFALGAFNPLVRMRRRIGQRAAHRPLPRKIRDRHVRRAGRPRRGVRPRIEDAAHLDDRHVRAAADLDDLHDSDRLVRAVSRHAAADAPRLRADHAPADKRSIATTTANAPAAWSRSSARPPDSNTSSTAPATACTRSSAASPPNASPRRTIPNWLRIATARPSIVPVAYRRADDSRRRQHDRSRRARRRAARIHIRARRARDARRARRPDDLDRRLRPRLRRCSPSTSPTSAPGPRRMAGRELDNHSHQPRPPRRNRSSQRHRHADVRPPPNADPSSPGSSRPSAPHALRVSAPPREKNSIAAPARYSDPAMTIDE